jgi:hypothetical protein
MHIFCSVTESERAIDDPETSYLTARDILCGQKDNARPAYFRCKDGIPNVIFRVVSRLKNHRGFKHEVQRLT